MRIGKIEIEIDRFIYWILLVFIFGLPLIIFPNIYNYATLAKITFLRTSAILILALWILDILYRQKIRWRHTPLDLPILIFFIFLLISSIFSINPGVSILGSSSKRFEELSTWFFYSVLFFAGLNYFSEREKIYTAVKVSVYAAAVVSVYGILQYLGYGLINPSPVFGERSFATLGNPIFLGGYLSLIFPLSLILIILEKPFKIKFLWFFSSFLILIALIFTYSRGAWLSALLATSLLIFLVAFKSRTLSLRKIFILIILLLFLVSIIAYLVEKSSASPFSIVQRLTSAAFSEGSVATRLSIWRTTTRLIADRPILGWGVETFGEVFPLNPEKVYVKLTRGKAYADRPHNQMLYIAFSMGLLGLLAYLWIIVTFILFVYKNLFGGYGNPPYSAVEQARPLQSSVFSRQSSVLLIGLFSASVAYLIQEQFSFSVPEITPIFWLSIAFALNLSLNGSSVKEIPINFSLRWRNLLVGAIAIVTVFSVLLSLKFVLADFNYFQGLKQERLENYLEASQLYEKAVSNNPRSGEYRLALGGIYKKLGANTEDIFWIEKAIKVYQKGIEHNSRAPDLYFGLGETYYTATLMGEGNDYTLAKEAFSKGLKLQPYVETGYYLLAQCYIQEGNYDQANRLLQYWKALKE